MQALLSLLWLVSTAQALYFFIDGATPKCFYEELPKDTLVSGQYAAEEYDDRTASWQQHQGLNIFITVDVRKTEQPLATTMFLPSHANMTFLFRRYSMTTELSTRRETPQESSISLPTRLVTTRSASRHPPLPAATPGSPPATPMEESSSSLTWSLAPVKSRAVTRAKLTILPLVLRT